MKAWGAPVGDEHVLDQGKGRVGRHRQPKEQDLVRVGAAQLRVEVWMGGVVARLV